MFAFFCQRMAPDCIAGLQYLPSFYPRVGTDPTFSPHLLKRFHVQVHPWLPSSLGAHQLPVNSNLKYLFLSRGALDDVLGWEICFIYPSIYIHIYTYTHILYTHTKIHKEEIQTNGSTQETWSQLYMFR